MAYSFSRKAEDDLIQFFVNGTRDFGIAQAEAYFAGLETTFAFLAEYPRAARERAEIVPPVRIHPYKAHVIVYAIRDDDILILRVRRAARSTRPSPSAGRSRTAPCPSPAPGPC